MYMRHQMNQIQQHQAISVEPLNTYKVPIKYEQKGLLLANQITPFNVTE